MLQFPFCHLHFCLPFSQLFQKYLKIKWLKLKMKRKGWKREEAKGERGGKKKEKKKKLEKDFSGMQKKTGIFSVFWEGPHQVVTAAPMAVLRKHSPFSLCLQPLRLKVPYGNYSHCSDCRFGPQPLLSKPHRRPGKNFFLWVPATVYTYKANTRC